MRSYKIFIILGLMLVCLSFVSAETIDIAKTIYYNNFTNGESRYYNMSISDNSLISTLDNSFSVYYSNILETNDNLIWDKFKWNSNETFSDLNISIQTRSNFREIINLEKDSLMVGWYLNETAGNYINSTNSKHNCSFTGSEIERNYTIMNRYAPYFSNNKNSSFTCADSDDFSTTTGNISIIFQFTYDDAITGDMPIVAKDNWDAKQDYIVRIENDGIRFFTGNNTNSDVASSSSNGYFYYFSKNQVYTVIVNYRDDNKTANFWINDEFIGDDVIELTGTTLYPGSNALEIGEDHTDNENSGEGYILSLGIYNQLLTPNDFNIVKDENFAGDGISVIMHHAIGTSVYGENPDYLNETQLREQLDYLKNNGYTNINPDLLPEYLNGNLEIPKKAFIFRVDDGLKDTLLFAEILDEYGWIGMSALVSNNQQSNPNYMNWTEVQYLYDTYNWKICSHTVTHKDLLTTNATELTFELEKSKEFIEGNTTGIIVDCLVYPFNRHNKTVEQNASLYYDYAYNGGEQKIPIYKNEDLFANLRTIDEDDNETTIIDFINKLKGYSSFNTVALQEVDNFYSKYINGSEYHYLSILNESSNKLAFRIKIDGIVKLNNLTFIKKLENNNYPEINTYSNTINYLDANYTTTTKTLELECTGTGNIDLTNLNVIKGSGGYYAVYHNDVFVEYANTNDYTTTSCSTWTFITSEYKSSASEAAREALNPFLSAFAIIMVGILAACGFALIKAFEGGDSSTMIIVASMAIGVTIVVLIGLYILGQVSTIVP